YAVSSGDFGVVYFGLTAAAALASGFALLPPAESLLELSRAAVCAIAHVATATMRRNVALTLNMRDMASSWLSDESLCGPLRISATSALRGRFNAERAEIRRGPQRNRFTDLWRSGIRTSSNVHERGRNSGMSL